MRSMRGTMEPPGDDLFCQRSDGLVEIVGLQEGGVNDCEGPSLYSFGMWALGGLIGFCLVSLYYRLEEIIFQRRKRKMLAEQEKHWPGEGF